MLSQCGGKTVQYFSTRHRRTPVSKPSVGSRDSEGIGVSRAKTAPSRVSDKLAVVREVRWRFAAQRLEDDNVVLCEVSW